MPELASVQACNILCLLLTDFFFLTEKCVRMCKEMCKDTVIQYLRGFTPGLSGYDSNMNRHVTNKLRTAALTLGILLCSNKIDEFHTVLPISFQCFLSS